MNRYDQLGGIIAKVRPRTIIEVGTHRGKRAAYMARHALRHVRSVSYKGFDVFETKPVSFHIASMNGKGIASRESAKSVLRAVEAEHCGRFTWELVTGDTRVTLAGKSLMADLVFIDGDHRVETIRSDYEAVRGARCIVFDDFYIPDGPGPMPNITAYGCNGVVSEIPRAMLLPVADPCRDGGLIKLVVCCSSTEG